MLQLNDLFPTNPLLFSNQKNQTHNNKGIEEKFNNEADNFVNKIDNSINKFRFNVSIALFYEMYNFIKKNLESQVSKKNLQTNIIKLMKLMLPFTPHLANECLELQNCKTVNKWPKINTGNIVEEIKLAVQINGKTRDIITTKKDLLKSKVNEIIHV